MRLGSMQRRKECDSERAGCVKAGMRGSYRKRKFFEMFVFRLLARESAGGGGPAWGGVDMCRDL